jgi:AcrR family transcriptional regulator
MFILWEALYMAKGFTEHEKELIKQKLQESCAECWSRYGYKRTNVSELCKMSGISTGAFYLFYDSKELLFIDTANKVSDRLAMFLDEHIPENPTKYDLAKALKLMVKELEKVEWLLSLSSDYEIFLRKLPPEFMEQNFKKDKTDFSLMAQKYHLVPKVSLDEMTSIFWILFMSLYHKKIMPDKFDTAFEFLIDSTIENLFE